MQDDPHRLHRRRFLAMVSRSAVTLGLSPLGEILAAEADRRETPDLITGPFYPQSKPSDQDADLTLVRQQKQRASGQLVTVTGRVLNREGQPVRNVRMEVWQANANGRYAHPSDPNTSLALDPHFQGYASLRTDGNGMYTFKTIKPGPYPTQRGDMRAPHIHIEVHGRTDRKVTQLFFPGEPLNDQDRHLQSVRRPELLIANVVEPSTAAKELLARWDIVLSRG
jgi:protocatechuate 3,4-dioxygenase beta subunit